MRTMIIALTLSVSGCVMVINNPQPLPVRTLCCELIRPPVQPSLQPQWNWHCEWNAHTKQRTCAWLAVRG
jgi:hypothetical protein